ncbi:uncharacterized protein LOC119718923 [Patiria miniata]|uniref:Ig-like domain-containing protein n=1 Tax=Patiria miniata TaxID=46514 RepID=A0A913Z0T9_PATMI|nr:uncharacterized protein LOC119718923 [Patiria miniata]
MYMYIEASPLVLAYTWESVTNIVTELPCCFKLFDLKIFFGDLRTSVSQQQVVTVNKSCSNAKLTILFWVFANSTLYSTMFTRCHRAPAMVIFWIVVLILFNLSASVSSQGATLNIIPERTDQPREGDSVTLVCQVTSSNPPDVIFWQRTNLTSGTVTIFVDETGLNSNADDRFSLDPITVVTSIGPVFSQRVTIKAIRESDEASYRCAAVTHESASQTLRIHPADEFPVCSPYGQATVVNGSLISCRTVKDSNIPAVTIPGMPSGAPGWITSNSMIGQNEGTELTHTVNTSDNGTTFTCAAIGNSPMALACKIGPLNVITNDVGGGLSSADIAGIVIGSILILIIIALHFLCCRCTPRRWKRTKSYLLDIGSSSFGTSNRRDNSAPEQPNSVELGNSQLASDDVPPSYESATGNEETEAVSDSPVVDERDPPATSDLHEVSSNQPEQGVNVYVNANVMSPFFAGDKANPIYDNAKVSPVRQNNGDDSGAGPKPKEIKRFAINRKGKMDKPIDPDAAISDSPDGNEFKKDPSVIYAKVDKTAKRSPHSVDTREDSGAGTTSKKIKRFALNRKVKVERAASPPKPEPVIVYAELDLHENQDGVRSPKEPRTEYAEIKR